MPRKHEFCTRSTTKYEIPQHYQTDWTMSCYNDTNISTNELSEISRIDSGLQLHPGFLQNLLRDLGIIRSNLQHLQNYTSLTVLVNGDRQLVKDINCHFDTFHVSHLVQFTIISIYQYTTTTTNTTTTSVWRPLFQDNLGKPLPDR